MDNAPQWSKESRRPNPKIVEGAECDQCGDAGVTVCVGDSMPYSSAANICLYCLQEAVSLLEKHIKAETIDVG